MSRQALNRYNELTARYKVPYCATVAELESWAERHKIKFVRKPHDRFDLVAAARQVAALMGRSRLPLTAAQKKRQEEDDGARDNAV